MSSQNLPAEAHQVAVVGLSGRFPGAPDTASLWRNLLGGIEAISSLSDEQMRRDGVPESWIRDPSYVKAAGLLDGVELFDAEFFGLSHSAAEVLNPQHRVFLECAWEALEDAGCEPGTFPGRIGVFAGSGSNGYLGLLERRSEAAAARGAFQTGISNAKDFLATAVAYYLDLKGPALAVQTACSTSLVAVHLACQSLLNGECDLALAGGVSITVPQHQGGFYEEGGILSPDGHCRAFDARAQGTVGGSGAGVVALRRLEDARRDGDALRAVILGSAINNDGASKAGFTAPGVRGQADVVAEALGVAGIAPETISFVEAHGTGTPLGDPIEVEALGRAFRGVPPGSCGLGSVKSSLGHLDTAAGVAGLIKTVLALEHGKLPPSLHFREPNPKIDLSRTPFYVVAELEDLPPGRRPWRAGVSSFGIGGTNAHVLLEAPPPAPASPGSGDTGPSLFVLSARSPEALEAASHRLADHLEASPQLDPSAVASSLLAGRRRFPYRRPLVAATLREAVEALRSPGPEASRGGELQGPVAFLFPGQGSQYPAMGRRLYEGEALFRHHFDLLAAAVEERYRLDLRTALYEHPLEAPGPWPTELLQPALFAVEYSLARLLMEWGIEPGMMLGHSLGEYVAASLAGVMDPLAAAVLVAGRGRLMSTLPAGAMVAVSVSEDEVRGLLGDGISLAAVNGPRRCVLSGSVGAVEALRDALAARGIAHRLLEADRAFHSRHLDGILDGLAELFEGVELRPPEIPVISSLTGRYLRPEEACDRRYWLRQAQSPVRFLDGLSTLAAAAPAALVEVGPGSVLSGLARQHRELRRRPAVGGLEPSGGADDSRRGALALLGELWREGVSLDATRVFAESRRPKVRLPTYPFQRRRYWCDGGDPLAGAGEGEPSGALAPWEPELPETGTAASPGLLRVIRAQQALMARQREALGQAAGRYSGEGRPEDGAGNPSEVGT